MAQLFRIVRQAQREKSGKIEAKECKSFMGKGLK